MNKTVLSSGSSKKVSDRRRSSYHFVFVPKYRYNVFRSSYVQLITKEIFRGIAQKYGFIIHAIEVASNHIHMFVEVPIRISLWHTIRLLKALSAKCIFLAFPGFRYRYAKGSFWSGYTYYESIGKVSADKIEKYILQSQEKHKIMNIWQARNAGASSAR